MRKAGLNITHVKDKINSYKGQGVNLVVNLGRNRFTNFEGIIESVYPSLFTVSVDDGDKTKIHSYSYSDVLCGQVQLSLSALE